MKAFKSCAGEIECCCSGWGDGNLNADGCAIIHIIGCDEWLAVEFLVSLLQIGSDSFRRIDFYGVHVEMNLRVRVNLTS